ncbi:MAG: FGGY-family carbohydrate kinase [Acidimicrobiales bacterium]
MSASVRAARCYVGHDLGTGGDKAALVRDDGEVLASAFVAYDLHHPAPNQVEQDPEDYWRAVGDATRAVLADAGVAPEAVAGVGFAGQMLTMVPLDARGEPVRPAISWLDSRADLQARRMARRLGGERVIMAIAGAVPSGKDVVCKIGWLRANEPEVFARVAAFCDATGFLVARATGHLIADDTAAGGTGVLNRKTRQWDRLLAALTRVPLTKMPPIRACAEVVGGLQPSAAEHLGLVAGTPVIAGMGDVPAAVVGSGALEPGDAHICLGTSGWLCVTTPEARDIGRSGVFSLPAADPGAFAMVGEMETAGECLDWLAEHVGVGEARRPGDGHGSASDGSVHERLLALAAEVPAGCDGLLFGPWMFGERAPVTDTTVRGAFVNLSLDHSRGHLVRAVLEGVAHNLRWLLGVYDRAGYPCPVLRTIGGGSRSDLWLQIVADVTQRRVEAVVRPQDAGAVGAALTVAVGLGDLPGYAAIKPLRPTDRVFAPDPATEAVHDRMHHAFRAAYPGLSRVGRMLNR